MTCLHFECPVCWTVHENILLSVLETGDSGPPRDYEYIKADCPHAKVRMVFRTFLNSPKMELLSVYVPGSAKAERMEDFTKFGSFSDGMTDFHLDSPSPNVVAGGGVT